MLCKRYSYNRTCSLFSQRVYYSIQQEHQLHLIRLKNIDSSYNIPKYDSKSSYNKKRLINNNKRTLKLKEDSEDILKNNEILMGRIIKIHTRKNEYKRYKNKSPLIKSLNTITYKMNKSKIENDNIVKKA